MYISFNLEHEKETITNFCIAESIINLCKDEHKTCQGLNAEVIAKMILLQIEKGGTSNE